MEKENVLPKNIRQIGEIQGREKVCMEDYVMTYIHKKEAQEEKGYLGILLGEKKENADQEYFFIRGILEVPAEEDGGPNEKQGNSLRERIACAREKYFPEWEIQGCCVIGTYPARRLEHLGDCVPECKNMIFHLQEQEETVFVNRGSQYHRINGYFVFYEQNRRMQDYMEKIFENEHAEKEAIPDRAIRSFRAKVKEKGEQKKHNIMKLASSFLVVMILMVGAIVVNRLDALQRSGNVSVNSGQTYYQVRQGKNGSEETSVSEKMTERTVEPVAKQNIPATENELKGSDAFWNELPEDTEPEETATETRDVTETVSRQHQAAYVIKTGDTLAGICQKYYGSMDRLEEVCVANSILNADMILQGQKIVLP